MNLEICKNCSYKPMIILSSNIKLCCINKNIPSMIVTYECDESQTSLLKNIIISNSPLTELLSLSKDQKYFWCHEVKLVNDNCKCYAEHLIDSYNNEENEK